MKYLFVLGRVLFSLIFFVKGIEHFSERIIKMSADFGMPLPHILVPLVGVLSLLGAISILLGYKVKVGTWLLIIFLLLITPCRHRFWLDDEFFAMMMHQYCFLKNLALLGACIMLNHFGPGPYSLDNK